MANKIVTNKTRSYRSVGVQNFEPLLLIFFMFYGCAAIPAGDLESHERTFPAGYDELWTSTMDALEGVHIKKANKETGNIVTYWVEGQPIQKGTGLIIDTYWIERYSFIISISRENEKTSRLTVLCMVQEKTKGGSRSFTWMRKKSSGEREEHLLDKVEKILASK